MGALLHLAEIARAARNSAALPFVLASASHKLVSCAQDSTALTPRIAAHTTQWPPGLQLLRTLPIAGSRARRLLTFRDPFYGKSYNAMIV
jgi:hypothetical protein